MKNILLYFTSIIIAVNVLDLHAQNRGPAGLPTTNNALWLRADEVDTTDLAPVRFWKDKSVNNNNALQNQITNAPTFYRFPGTNNNKPFVSFLGSNDQLIVLDKPGSKLDSTAQMTIITAIRPKNTATLTTAPDDANAIISKRSDCVPSRANWTCSDYSLFIWDQGKVFTDVVSDNNRFATGNNFLTDNQTSLIGLTFNGLQSANDRVKIYRNGNLEFTATNEASNFIPNSNSALVLAAMDSGSLNSFKSLQADYYEIVMFNRLLNSAERQILENYMASRYNITIPTDYYSHDAFNTLNWFGEDVSGVGRFNSFERHLTGTSAELTLSNPSNLNSPTTADNGKFLLFGNNGAVPNSWNTIFGAGNNILSVDRKWRIDEKNRLNFLLDGDAGTFSVSIDTATLPAKPLGFSKFVLIVDNDFDFANGNQVFELTYNTSTGRYTGTNINFNDGDMITIGVLKPQIQFELPVSAGNEFNNASIKVMLNYIAESPVTVNYQTIYVNSAKNNNVFCVDTPNYVFGNDCFECYLSADAGDYKDTSGTLTILKGTSFSNVVVKIYDDICGGDGYVSDIGDYFDIQIQSPSAGVVLGSNTTHRYFITDDDDSRIIRFTNASSTVNENVGVLQVQVELNNASVNNNTTIEYYIQGLTATNLADYMEDSSLTGSLIFGTITIPPNTLTGNILVDIKDDLLYEFSENAKIVLFDSKNGRLTSIAAQKEHTFTITDNDVKPKVNIVESNYTINEEIGILEIEVALTERTGVPVTVNFTGSNNSATLSGIFADYAYGNGTSLNINPGTLDTVIRLVILDDARIETSEVITVNIVSATNADLGTTLVSTITILDNDVIGITGPGGVGDSSLNVLWLRADDLALANNAQVPSWSDVSGNGFTASQGSNRPTYVTSTVGMNNRPSILFNGTTSNSLDISDHPLLDNATEFSIFVAAKVNTTAASVGILEKRTASNPTTFNTTNSYFLGVNRVSGTDFRLFADFNTSNLRRTQSTGIMTNTTVLTPKIFSAFFNGTVASPQKIRIGIDNTLPNTTGSNQPSDLFKTNNSAASLRIGTGTGGGSARFNGNIAEVIMYRSALNDPQRIIVNNYLASKYNIPIASDLYSYESIGFGNDVAGIGQINNLAHSAAKGKGIVTIGWPTDLQNDEWLFFGHDNGSITTLNTTDIPSIMDDRYSRVWVVNETGDVGTVSISFDLNPYSSADPNSLVLLRSSVSSFLNATFDSTNRVYDPIRKRITFSGINFSNGQFFTIGRMSSAALPVELLSFDAEQKENHVILNWTTLTEINAHYFEVQRSVNGEQYETIGNVSAAGNSSTQINYQLLDEQPLEGVSYYRLKQVDFDGAHEYFGPVSVNFEKNKGQFIVAVYPNPITDNEHLNIVLKGIEKAEDVNVNIYNSLGQIVSKHVFLCQNNCTNTISLADLAVGSYFIEINHASNRYIQKLKKQ